MNSFRVISLAITKKQAIRAIDLHKSADLQCVNLMCERVGDACVCRLARFLEQHADGLQDVEELNLGGNRLHMVPEQVGGLKKLKKLDLSGNQLGGKSIPFQSLVANLPELEFVNLSSNAEIKDSDIPEEWKDICKI